MIPTLTFVRERFAYLNGLIFEGRLAEPVFKVVKARTFLGKVSAKLVRQGILAKPVLQGPPVLKISSGFDLEPEKWDGIIAHEMIHLYILTSGLKDRSAHGPLFRSMMADINARFGLGITISSKEKTILPPRQPRAARKSTTRSVPPQISIFSGLFPQNLWIFRKK